MRLQDAGVGMTPPTFPRASYPVSCISISPSTSRHSSKRSPVVAIGVDRHSVGRDNGTRKRVPHVEPKKESGPNFACTGFSAVRTRFRRMASCLAVERVNPLQRPREWQGGGARR